MIRWVVRSVVALLAAALVGATVPAYAVIFVPPGSLYSPIRVDGTAATQAMVVCPQPSETRVYSGGGGVVCSSSSEVMIATSDCPQGFYIMLEGDPATGSWADPRHLYGSLYHWQISWDGETPVGCAPLINKYGEASPLCQQPSELADQFCINPPSAGGSAAPTSKPPSSGAPKRLTVPSVKVLGTAKVGKALVVKLGNFKTSGSTIKYQWLQNSKPIKGATKSKLVIKKAYKGRKISVRVTASKTGWATVQAWSAAVKVSR